MPPSAHWLFVTEGEVIARLEATASDVNCVVATFRDDFNTCDGRPQVIATGPDDGIDDSKYNEAGFSWMAARQIVLREVHAVKKRHSQLSTIERFCPRAWCAMSR